MPKRTLLIPVILLLAGCDKSAIRFAKETKKLLQEYQKRVEAQISETEKYQGRHASLSASANWRRLNDTLDVERDERSTELAADYLEGRKPASLYRSQLRAYAQLEYEQRRQSLAANVDGSFPYLERLAALDADKENIQALSKMLGSLAENQSFSKELKDLESLVTDTKTAFDKQVCAELKKKGSAAAEKLRSDRHCMELEKAASQSGGNAK